MGKYSKFEEKRPKDFWGTVDSDATKPLAPWVEGKTYAEPCYGDGDLEIQLIGYAECKWRSDIRVDTKYGFGTDATILTKEDLYYCDLIITNPPFKWEWLQPLLDHLPTLKPTWLLLPADSMHNKRMAPYMAYCERVLSVGRLYWVLDPDVKPIKGKDNYIWAFWPDLETKRDTIFHERLN